MDETTAFTNMLHIDACADARTIPTIHECVLHIVYGSFYPSKSSTTSVRADSSTLERCQVQVMLSQDYAWWCWQATKISMLNHGFFVAYLIEA